MAPKSESNNNKFLDVLKWGVVFILIAGGIAGNYAFSDIMALKRALILIAIGFAALFVALQTEKGRHFWVFALDAKTEIRKVVWPTRQETLQVTAIVLLMVVVVGLVLWGIDAMLLRAIAWLTGLGAT